MEHMFSIYYETASLIAQIQFCMDSFHTCEQCYAKRSPMSWVVVIRVTLPTFFWYDTDILGFSFIFYFQFLDFFFWKVGVIPRAPFLLLVWPRLRTLGTFLHGATHMWAVTCSHSTGVLNYDICPCHARRNCFSANQKVRECPLENNI